MRSNIIIVLLLFTVTYGLEFLSIPPLLSCHFALEQEGGNCSLQFAKSVALFAHAQRQEKTWHLYGSVVFERPLELFGILDLKVNKLELNATQSENQWQHVHVQGTAQTKHAQFLLSANLLQAPHVKLQLLNKISILQVAQDLGVPVSPEVMQNVQVLVHDVAIVLNLKQIKQPQVQFEVALQASLFDISIHARANLKMSMESAELDGRFEKLMHFGPFAINAVGFLLSVSTKSQSLTVYGSLDFWYHHNLNASVELKHLDGAHFGYKVTAEIPHLKLEEFVPMIRDIPMAKDLHLGKSGIVYSSYPIATPDGILRKGLALYTGIVMHDGPFAGFNRVLGGKKLELPAYLNLGEVVSGWDMKDLRISTRMPFDFPIRTHFFGYSGPLGFSIGFAPFGAQATMGFVVRFPFDEQDINFLLAVDVDVTNAKGMAECSAGWNKPFGITGLSLRNVAADVAINYYTIAETYTPNRIAITGDCDFPGLGRIRLTFMYDLVPSFNFAFVGHLGKSFALSSIIETANAFYHLNIPPFIPDIVRLCELELYVSPRGATIGSIDMPMGIGFSFQLELLGSKVYGVKAHVSTTSLTMKGFAKGFNFFDMIKLDDVIFDMVASPIMQYFKMHGLLTLNVPCLDVIKHQATLNVNMLGIEFVYESGVLKLTGQIATMNPKNATIHGSFNGNIINQMSNLLSQAIEVQAKILSTIENGISKDMKAAESFKRQFNKIIVPRLCKALRLPFESMGDNWIDQAMEQESDLFFIPPTPKRVCERLRERLQKIVDHVKQVSSHLANLRRKMQDLAAHFSVQLLRQRVFRINSMQFDAQLQHIKTNGFITVRIDMDVLNKKREFTLELTNVAQVTQLASTLLSKLK